MSPSTHNHDQAEGPGVVGGFQPLVLLLGLLPGERPKLPTCGILCRKPERDEIGTSSTQEPANGAFLTLLIGTYIACELIGNVAANVPVTLLGGRLTVPGGVFIYALTFTLVDLINERRGKAGARQVVYTALLANVLLALYTRFLAALPNPPYFLERGAGLLTSTWRIVAGGLAAYLVSSMIDIQVFAWWRRRVGRWPWLRVLASNAVSTLVDSAAFITLAFAGVFPVLPLIAGQYLVKMAMTVISLPLIYATRRLK